MTSTVLVGPETSTVTYEAAFLDRGQADALFAWMLQHAPWQAERPFLFGKHHDVKRQTCAFGTPGLAYRYSGVLREANPWPEVLLGLVHRLHNEVDPRINFALANHYPDGEAYIGPHSDDEADMLPDAPIVGISLGAVRTFRLLPKDGGDSVDVELAHGSALVMWGKTQRHYRHSVPKRLRCKEPRVSLTFRCFQ